MNVHFTKIVAGVFHPTYLLWRLCLMAVVFCGLSGCISEVEFKPDGQSFIVISGVITNSFGERTIVVSRNSGLGTVVEPVAAAGSVYKNGVQEAELIALNKGMLVVPIDFKVEAGSTYYIEIKTEENRIYHSKPQLIPPKFRTDSLSFQLVRQLGALNSLGIPITTWLIEVFAHVNVIDNGLPKPYYKWQVDESWSVISVAGTCYVLAGVESNESAILDARDLGTPYASVRIASALLDESFLHKHYFNAYLHSLNEDTYNYYRKVQRLVDEVGTLFDEIPAPIQGNVFVTGGEEETVLGNVEFSLVDTLRLLINREDIDLRLFNPCTIPCPPFTPCVCSDCGIIYGQASKVKPFYWE